MSAAPRKTTVSKPWFDLVDPVDPNQMSLFEAEEVLEADGAIRYNTEGLTADYEIVEAPVPSGPVKLPTSLRKVNAAIHVYPTEGTYGLGMRRLFNVLLALSHNQIRAMGAEQFHAATAENKVVTFYSNAAQLRQAIGWEKSGANDVIYEMLDSLTTMKVVWDALAPDGKRESWLENSTLLNQWGRSSRNRVSWRWLPDVASLLFDPKHPYTPLKLDLMRQFRSSYTVALFENVYRFHKLAPEVKYTPWRPVKDWQLLIVGPGRYTDYRDLKSKVFKTAMDELRQRSECPIEAELEEKRGPRNRVEQVRFRFWLKASLKPTAADAGTVEATDELGKQLQRLGVAPDKVAELAARYDHAYLAKQLGLTRRTHERKPLSNPAGYFVRAVEDGYEDARARAEAETQRYIEQQRSKEGRMEAEKGWAGLREAEAQAWIAALSSERLGQLRQAFLEAQPPMLRAKLLGKFEGRAFANAFRGWVLKKHPECLTSPAARDFDVFQAQNFPQLPPGSSS